MNIALQKATEADCATIAELARNIWLKHYIDIISVPQIEYMLEKMYSAGSLAEQMHNGHLFYFILNGGEKKGYISISIDPEKNCFLHKFYMDTNEQNKGIGSKAFALLLNELNGCNSIRLGVNRANFKSVNFYFKLGFRIEKMLDTEIGNGYTMDDFIMVRDGSLRLQV